MTDTEKAARAYALNPDHQLHIALTLPVGVKFSIQFPGSSEATDKLLAALDLLEGHADSFVSHWVEDDGNDEADKKLAADTSDAITDAAALIRAYIGSARP